MRFDNRSKLLAGGLSAAMLAALLVTASPAAANHPVFVEGNCFAAPGAGGLQQSPVAPGTCGDYDGDGLIGAAEDTDGDNTYGTIGAAVTAVANNGVVQIVSSGTFAEIVTLAPVDGANLTLEAAPGVDANIDAVVQGDPGSGARQNAPGIIIDGCDGCRVTVRNVMTRNWTEGVLVRGSSHATLDQVQAENNLNFGIHSVDDARVAINESDVNATGFRKNTSGVGTARPGAGIVFEDDARGSVHDTTVTGSAGPGIAAAVEANVELVDIQAFDNNPNFKFQG